MTNSNPIEVEILVRKILTLNLAQRSELFAEFTKDGLVRVALLLSAMADQTRNETMTTNTAKNTKPLSAKVILRNLIKIIWQGGRWQKH